MGRCFGIGVHAIIDGDWPLRSVEDRPIVASSTCYSSEQDLEKKNGFMQGTSFERNCSAQLPSHSTADLSASKGTFHFCLFTSMILWSRLRYRLQQ